MILLSIAQASILAALSIILPTVLFAQKKSAPNNMQKRVPSANILPLLQKAAQKEQQQDLAGAYTLYSEAIAANPQDVFGYYQRGLLSAGKLGNCVAAIKDLSKAIELWNTFSMAYCLRGTCYTNIQNLAAAITDLNTAIVLDSTNLLAYMNLAAAYRLNNQYREGEKIISQAIRRRGDVMEFYLERIEINYRLSRFREALEDCNIVLAKEQHNLRANKYAAAIKVGIKDYQGAIENYTLLIKQFGYQKEFYFGRSDAFRELGRFSNAQADLQTIIASAPGASPEFFAAKAKTIENYVTMREFSRSADSATSFLRINPQDNYVFTNILGVVNIFDRQEKFYNAAVYGLRGIARKEMGDITGARQDFVKSLILGLPQAKDFLDSLRTAYQVFKPDTNFPANLQFYPRQEPTNTAIVPIQGTLFQQGFDSAYCEIWAEGKRLQRLSAPLQYQGTQANITFAPQIKAALREYSFRLGVKSATGDTILSARKGIVCGDVIAISGQSNIVYGSLDSLPNSHFVRTFFMGSKEDFWWQPSGNRAKEASIGAVGLTLADELMRSQQMPICVLNLGIEGSIIEAHFPDAANPLNPRTWYGRMLWRLRESGLSRAIKTFVWYQGESNSEGNGDNERYGVKFLRLHTALQSELPILQKTYIVQIRPSQCVNTVGHAQLREEQRLLGLKSGFEVLASTSLPGYDDCHYADIGYQTLGRRLSKAIQRDVYASSLKPEELQTAQRELSPMLEKAFWANNEKSEIVLQFRSSDDIIAGADTMLVGKKRSLLNDAFLLDAKPVAFSALRIEKNRVFLRLSAPMPSVQRISYIPDKCYPDSPSGNCYLYNGPWLESRSGVGVLTFHNVVVEATP
ncbi:MAG: hypothetical protein MUF71_19230 [Candidatus Kapabacteria bacterium]|jgi:tetratricopeptide (TPR) repeat protein|nr:hypothetical protein [Candidatus Kapabacteria bacterium]